MNNDELIHEATKVLHRHTTEDGRLFGDVGAALVTSDGNLYVGVCADTASWGLGAERSALAAMITGREYKVRTIVAVWRDDQTGRLHVLPPCGVCREFMRSVDPSNLDAEIVLGRQRQVSLSHLLPEHQWPDPID